MNESAAPKVITPTVGRNVWFFAENQRHEQPRAAIVTHVWNDRCVNLCVFSHDGVPAGRTSVVLLQPGDPVPRTDHAQWMPYQVGQAQRHAGQAEIHADTPAPGPRAD